MEGDANHLRVGIAACLRGNPNEVGARLQLDLTLFALSGVQGQGSESYLVIGGEALNGTITAQLAGDLDRPLGVHTGDEGSRGLAGREDGLILLQVVAVHFFLLTIARGGLHHAVAGFLEVAFSLLIEGVLQGDVGGQTNDEAGHAERHHQDRDEARTQVRHVPHFLGGGVGVLHAPPSRAEANVEVLHRGYAP